MTTPKISKVHVCVGGCGGEVDNDTFMGRNGKTAIKTCQASSCKDFHKPFHLKLKCDACGVKFAPGTMHNCA